MSAQGGSGAGNQSPGPLRTVGLGVVGLTPFAMAGSIFTPTIGEYPLWSVAAIVVLVWPVGFAMRVAGELVNRWVPRAADRVERGLGRHRKRYLESLHEHVRHLEVLGVATQGEFTLKLGDVYVDVALSPKSAADSRGGPIERQSLARVIENSESGVVAVIGGPGSGKTTLVRHEALSMCGRKRGGLPILLEIRQHTAAIVGDPRPGLAELAASPRAPREWLEERLAARECVVLLDGLDEVADEDDRRVVVEWLRGQISAHPGNRFVITSRPYGYDENPLPNADRVEVQPFTDAQVENFLHAWCEAVERRSTGEDGPAMELRAKRAASSLLDRLREHGPLLDFAANPLLLTMIALVHRYRGALPGTRAKLYEEMCAVLLHRRREAKGLATRDELSGEQKERVARALARSMMEHGERDVRNPYVVEAILPTLTRMRPATSASDFLREATRSGLLVEPREGTYAFAHLTLQEYLAAVDIREKGDEEVLLGRIGSGWWRETILLWAADADVTPVVEACTDEGTVEAAVLAGACVELGRELEERTQSRFFAFLESLDDDQFLGYLLGMWLSELKHRKGLLAPISRRHLRLLLNREAVPDPRADDPAVDVSREDAASLPSRLNTLQPEAGPFRLPTTAELEDPGARLPDGATVWVRGDSGPELWCPPGARHPFQVTLDELVLFVGDIAKPGANGFAHLPEKPPVAYFGLLRPYLARQIDAMDMLASSTLPLQRMAKRMYTGLGDSNRLHDVAALADTALRGGPTGQHPVLHETFTYVLCALAVHELRANGTITPNEILVLARD